MGRGVRPEYSGDNSFHGIEILYHLKKNDTERTAAISKLVGGSGNIAISGLVCILSTDELNNSMIGIVPCIPPEIKHNDHYKPRLLNQEEIKIIAGALRERRIAFVIEEG